MLVDRPRSWPTPLFSPFPFQDPLGWWCSTCRWSGWRWWEELFFLHGALHTTAAWGSAQVIPAAFTMWEGKFFDTTLFWLLLHANNLFNGCQRLLNWPRVYEGSSFYIQIWTWSSWISVLTWLMCMWLQHGFDGMWRRGVRWGCVCSVG
jgi:hypothetical protein